MRPDSCTGYRGDVHSINTLRGILVGMAAFAAVVAAFTGFWAAAVVLTIGVIGHAVFWFTVDKRRERTTPASR